MFGSYLGDWGFSIPCSPFSSSLVVSHYSTIVHPVSLISSNSLLLTHVGSCFSVQSTRPLFVTPSFLTHALKFKAHLFHKSFSSFLQDCLRGLELRLRPDLLRQLHSIFSSIHGLNYLWRLVKALPIQWIPMSRLDCACEMHIELLELSVTWKASVWYFLSTHADRQGVDISFTVCLFVVRLRISTPRIKLAASNFAQRFIGIQGRESAIFWTMLPQKPKIGAIGQLVKDDECSSWWLYGVPIKFARRVIIITIIIIIIINHPIAIVIWIWT